MLKTLLVNSCQGTAMIVIPFAANPWSHPIVNQLRQSTLCACLLVFVLPACFELFVHLDAGHISLQMHTHTP